MAIPILEAIQGKQLVRDHCGNLVEIGEWSRDMARGLAKAEGLTLTDEHFEVLDFLRDYAISHGAIGQGAQHILRALEERFAEQGGRRWLFLLFPGGPVRQGMKLAGLPEAPHAADPSFGSVS